MVSAVPKKKVPTGNKALHKKPKGPVMPRAGRTLEGCEYLTTHTCPACMAVMTTIGAGYPQIVCSRCIMPMVAKSSKVGN